MGSVEDAIPLVPLYLLVLEGHCYAWRYESFFFFKFIEKPHN